MRMNEGVEWAAHCVTLLSTLPEGAALSAASLAEYHGVPAPYLAKSLQALARAGIVSSAQGRRGGYRLTRDPSQITLLDVVEAVDGDEPLFRCTEIRKRGPSRVASGRYPSICGIAAAMHRAEDAWRNELRRTTIADLAAVAARQAPPAAIRKTQSWLAAKVSGERGAPA